MIKAEELRIGNWARNSYGDVWRITGQDITWFSLKSKLYYGIHLTHDVLLKCGFQYDTITYSLGRISLAPGNGGMDVFLCGISGGIITNIQYVHQLQNLYFALTGGELNFKL